MCGIFGLFGSRAVVDASAAALEPALDALAHRGPDGQGTARAAAGDVAVALAHTRLAILDLSPAGQQPMRGPSGELLVLNGEIYNHLELRPALERAGVRFSGTSDTETLLHLLLREGPAALDRLVGMFALAFWDPRRASLLLARDRLGKKPLYLVDLPGGGLAFASEVRALFAAGVAPRVLDPAGLALWLARGSSQDPTTLVRGVRSLGPGHHLTLTATGHAERRWWTLAPAPFVHDWRDRLEDLLDTAVRQRLLSDRPLGVFLSGGVDSAALAAVAARHARASLETFTLTFEGARWNEGDRAAAMAARLGLRHHASHLLAAEALGDLDAAIAAQDLPSHDGLNTWFVTRAARAHGLVVALSGAGGDELFGGYPHFRRFGALCAVGARARRLPLPVRERLRAGLLPALPTRARKALALLSTEGHPEAVYAILREMFAPATIAYLLGRTSAPPRAAHAPEAPLGDTPDARTRLSLLELGGYLVDTQLRDIDAMSMAHALEVRAPLLDHRLVAAVLAVPPEHRAPSRGINKRLLVDLARLPHEAFRAPKRGFAIPWHAWLRGPLAAWTRRHLTRDRVATLGALAPAAVTAELTRFERGHGGVDATRILSLVALVSWCVRHDVHAA